MIPKTMEAGTPARRFLLAVLLGGAPLVTAASCDPNTGNFTFFRDDGLIEDVLDEGDFFDDDHHHDDGFFFDIFQEDYFYDDCFDCF
ncbi:MAG: hypothetical protein ACE5E5_01310 [Phycisphaerae bacterium]